MQITITLRGMLTRYLPAGSGRQSRSVEVADDATIDAVLTHLDVPKELAHLVLLNGEAIPTSRFQTTALHAQDALAVWPPLSGG